MKLKIMKKIKFLFEILVMILFISCTNTKNNKEASYSLLRGMQYLSNDNLTKALNEYEKSYSLDPNNPILLKEMGYIYYRFGDYKESEKYYKKALEISPEDDGIIKNLVALYFKQKDYNKALEIINSSYNPNSLEFKEIKSKIYYETKNYEKTKEILKNIDKKILDRDTYIIFLKVNENKKENYKDLIYGKKLFPKDKKYIIFYVNEIVNKYKEYDNAEQVLLEYLADNGSDNEIIEILENIYQKQGKINKTIIARKLKK